MVYKVRICIDAEPHPPKKILIITDSVDNKFNMTFRDAIAFLAIVSLLHFKILNRLARQF